MNGPSPLPGVPRARAPTPAAWLMILVVAGAAAELAIYVNVMPGIDLYQFWLVGREVQKGTLDVGEIFIRHVRSIGIRDRPTSLRVHPSKTRTQNG